SPSNVSTDVDLFEYQTSPRDGVLRIRVGDPDRTITAPTATYVLSYDVRGALRTPQDRPELYWDVTGSTMGRIQSSTVRVTVPGGAQDTQCFVGPPGTASTDPCDAQQIEAGQAVFTQGAIPEGSLLTIGVQMAVGAVANATPIRSERGDAADERNTRIMQGAGAAAALGIPLVGWLWYRRNGHDDRYAGVPPGTVPLAGAPAQVQRNDPDIQVPVAFSPPRIPLTWAGFLVDGHYRTEHLTATLVGLATHGAIQLSSEGKPRAYLRDPAKAPDEPSSLLLSKVFRRGQDVVDLGKAGQLAGASDALADDAYRVAMGNRWFRRLSRGRKSMSAMSVLWMVMIGAFVFDVRVLAPLAWFLVPATAALVITLLVVRARMARGQRTALGRAWTDQVEGFRTYIATAEADQLRFEEGEDIFSRYLPWAVLFGLTEHWVHVCEQAIALGRLAQPDTSWYGGTFWDARMILWNLDTIGSSMGPASAPSVAASGPSFTSDTGFGGGGSAFGRGGFGGGGGFAGGGGGGGGGGSW
ncbi:MAG: DUF2207 domain-containing protein, partial [Actinomycetes bacterium]